MVNRSTIRNRGNMDHNSNPLKNNDDHNVVPVYKQDMKQCAILLTKNKDQNGNYYPKLNELIIKSDDE